MRLSPPPNEQERHKADATHDGRKDGPKTGETVARGAGIGADQEIGTAIETETATSTVTEGEMGMQTTEPQDETGAEIGIRIGRDEVRIPQETARIRRGLIGV